MPEVFVASLGLALAGLFCWAFKTLPGENWQFIGSIPTGRSDAGWKGVNFTWYGFFAATAYASGCALFVLLMGSVGVPLLGSASAIAVVLLVCAPASSLIVRWVEGTRYGFTVGGASFLGLWMAPLVFISIDAIAPGFGFEMPVTVALAALSIAYVLGEGIGRLACISFGCCYGKPVEETRGWVRLFARRFHFVFSGPTKKIAFAAGLDGERVVPVQAMTAVVHSVLGLTAIGLFCAARYSWVIPVAMTTSQIWRAYSETFRADYRGPGRFTAYQLMAGLVVVVTAAAPVVLPAQFEWQVSLLDGLAVLWSPEALLVLQAVWVILFVYMGRSSQTGSRLRFHVREDRVGNEPLP